MPSPIAPTFSLSGAPNFRDLGGYRTASGQTVRRHRLFRSDHLGSLAPSDLAQLGASLGRSVRVLDLRGETERTSAVCSIPGATVHSLPIEPTIVQRLAALQAAGASISGAETVALMQETYRNFVRANTPRFAAVFAHALEAQDAPLVFHCTAGKDRTGFAAALLLHALGVDAPTVMHDYLLTNQRLAGRIPAGNLLPREVAAVLWAVQPAFLEAAFETVEQDHGGVEPYLRHALGLGPAEREQLRSLYLEPGAAV